MRSLLVILSFSGIIFAQGVLSATQVNGFETLETKGESDTIRLLKDQKSSFAIVRGDILYLSNKGLEGLDFKDYYIIGKIKQKSQLFLVTKKSLTLNSEQQLKSKRISVDNLYNLNNIYLKDIISKTDKSVRYSIHFQFYSLEESLQRIKDNKLDIFFAFENISLGKRALNNKGLEITILPIKFINVLLENKGLKNIANKIEVEHYIIVRNDIDKENSTLVNMILNLDKKKMLVSKVDKGLGLIYPEIDAIIEEHGNNLELMKKLKVLATDIKSNKKSILKLMSKVKKEVAKVKTKANTFTLRSVQMDYKNQATDIMDELDGEKDKLKRIDSKVDSFLKDKNKEGLHTLVASLESMNDSISDYEKSAKKIIRKMEQELVKEQEEAEAKALLEATKIESDKEKALP